MKLLLVASQAASVWAHGGLVGPKTWWNQYGARPIQGGSQVTSIEWFMNWTFIPEGVSPKLKVTSMAENLKTSPRGYGIVQGTYDRPASEGHPWVAPGTAPIDSPCGIKGGNKRGCFAPGSGGPQRKVSSTKTPCAGGGTDEAKDSMTQDSFKNYFQSPETTYWRAGETAETAWGVIANHGGGYTFRLCPVNSFDATEIIQKVTEECFEANGLEFSGNQQWVQYKADVAGRTAVTPILVTGNDVKPAGSQWRKNPIPACKGYSGGSDGNCAQGPWFEPPVAGLSGFGNVHGQVMGASDFIVIDKVKVPNTPGKYVLGWRYDCEQTPQIWFGCSNIQILGPTEKEPPKAASCICPQGKILDSTAVAKVLPEYNNYKWTCSEAEAHFKAQTQHSCAIIQQYVVQREYPHCCIDPPPAPEPEGDLGGGTSYDEGAPEPESEGEPEAEPETEPEPATTPPPSNPKLRDDACICSNPSQFSNPSLRMPHGYRCLDAANWVKGGTHDCGTVHQWYGHDQGRGLQPWSKYCCGTSLTQVETKFSHRVQVHAHDAEGAKANLTEVGRVKVAGGGGIDLWIPVVGAADTGMGHMVGSVSPDGTVSVDA